MLFVYVSQNLSSINHLVLFVPQVRNRTGVHGRAVNGVLHGAMS